MHDGARHHRHHRHQHRRQAGHVGRQQADNGEPRDVADAHRHDGDVDQRQQRGRRRPEGDALAEPQRTQRDRHRGHQQLPTGQHRGRHRHAAALDDHRARSPAHGRQQAQRQSQGRLRVGIQAAPHQQQDAAGRQRHRQPLAQRQAFAKHQPGDQRRPHRHREAQHRRLARRDQHRRQRRSHVPDRQVDHGACEHRPPVLPRNAQVLPAQTRHAQQQQAGTRHRDRAKGPDRDLAHHQREQRPVGAPDEGQQRQQHQGTASGGLRAGGCAHASRPWAAANCTRNWPRPAYKACLTPGSRPAKSSTTHDSCSRAMPSKALRPSGVRRTR